MKRLVVLISVLLLSVFSSHATNLDPEYNMNGSLDITLPSGFGTLYVKFYDGGVYTGHGCTMGSVYDTQTLTIPNWGVCSVTRVYDTSQPYQQNTYSTAIILHLDGFDAVPVATNEWNYVVYFDASTFDEVGITNTYTLEATMVYSDGSTSTLVSEDNAKYIDVSGTFEQEADINAGYPESIVTSILFHDGREGGVYVSFFDEQSEPNETGGYVYNNNVGRTAKWYDFFGPAEIPVPMDPEDVASSTETSTVDPLTGNTSQPGGSAGGVTSTTVPVGSEDMHNAMEAALGDRQLSAKQIGDAVQDALANQGMSSENMQQAVEKGVADGNNKVERSLDKIESQLAGGNAWEGVKELEGVGYTNQFVDTGISNTFSQVATDIDDSITFVEQWFGSFFTIPLPTSLGQRGTAEFSIPGSPPEAWNVPDAVYVDTSSWTGVSWVRGLEEIVLGIAMLFLCYKIFGWCF